ncbi:Non-specific serine/threonine protein kinase [Heracleum sosnowskyi]|uniref:non-specific serine/threonine protein kinase n=1 Tax=Heracleum sosnowskyi TaxID=360622 RepID=A0AAD8GTJ5_9APIA|nr:Non-specific serine/threonine protein kinase [Heracleum sosnowskyi]
MATYDHRPSCTKHRRNSNDETQNSSKRYKHHHHRSKNHEIKKQLDYDIEEGERKRSRGIKEMARERDRDKDSVRERDRVRDKEKRDRKRPRDRDCEKEDVGNCRRCKYQDVNNTGDLDKHSDNMYQRSLDKDYKQRSRTNEKEQIYSYETDNLEMDGQRIHRDEVESEDLQETILHFAEQEEDLNRIKEESRRRRQAILEKYKAQESQQKHELKSEETAQDSSEQPSKSIGEVYSSSNQSVDMILDDTSVSLGMSPEQKKPPASKISSLATLGEGTPKSKGSDDMFCDDFFGHSPAGVCNQGKKAGLKIEKIENQDNKNDAEGYYKYRIGEVLDGRYEIVGPLGEGVFSNVVCAIDHEAKSSDPEMVAIKIIRCNDIMYKAGLNEVIILKKLVDADPKDMRHCVRFQSSFEYNNHLCLVFESLDMNLRQYLKKFGCEIGLELTAVRDFARQLFIALEHLKNCGVLHCDIKPDNMLVNEANTVLKLSDFGSAMLAGKNEIAPYLVSRFYRAPEIILGLSYNYPMDIWSVGCCLYEFYTGKVLYPGTSNNDMLRLHTELKGLFPKKMLRKGAFTPQHFDQDLNFFVMEEDPFTKKAMKRLIRKFELKDFSTKLPRFMDDDQKMFANFKDLLDKIFVLNPDKRITVSEALSHPFITGK